MPQGVGRLNDIKQKPSALINGRLNKRSKKRVVRTGILLANIVLLLVVGTFVIRSPKSAPVASSSLAANSGDLSVNALDQVSSADIAVHVARMTNLDEAVSVSNKADTVNAQLAVSAADVTVVAKPQVVATALKSKKDIQTYVVKEGDTIPSLAAKFGITSDTIRWSNGLTGDNVTVGKELVISPVNGLVYTVKEGDTPDSLASKYRANKDQIIAFNDAEIGGLKVGERIVIPDGNATPLPTRRFSAPSTAGFAWGGGAVYSGNGYDYGYCTWYVKNRRPDLPSNLGNASTWKALAQQAGIPTGSTPRAGAVIWTPPRDYYGHVGYVESVNPDGSVNVSEMNVVGWGVVSRKTLSAAEAARYGYIY